MLLVYFGAQSFWALSLLALVLLLGVVLAIQAHRHRALGGNEELPGMTGEITELDTTRGHGRAMVRGELWQVRSTQPLQIGQSIRVVQEHGLILLVEPCDDAPLSPGDSL